MDAYPSHLFNFLVAWILFISIGIPMVSTYYYSGASYAKALKYNVEDVPSNTEKAMVSGRFGQGAFPMTFITTFVATFIYFKAAFEFCHRKPEEDDE